MTTRHDADNPIIYIRMPNWVGDLCMCLPILHALLHTQTRIVVCARPWAQELLRAYPLHGFVPISGSLRQSLHTLRHFKQKQPPHQALGLVIPDSFSSAALFRLANIPSAGYRDEARSVLLKWPMSKPVSAMHAVEFWYHLAYSASQRWQLTIPPSASDSLGLHVSDKAIAACDTAMVEAGIQAGHYILLAPTAKNLHKKQLVKSWSHYGALSAQLQSMGYRVVMCPPPSERDYASKTVPNTSLVAPLALDAFSILCQRSALVICNDSGVSHLAAATQAPQLSLFGVTNPQRTRPWSPTAHTLGTQDHWPTLDEVITAVSKLVPKV